MAQTIGNLAVLVSANGAKLASGLQAAKKTIAGFVGGVSGIGGTVANAGLAIQGVFGGVASLAGAGIKAAVSTAAEFEKTELVMSNMLGGIKQAKDMLGDLAKLDMRSPFEFGNLVQGSQGLLAIGFNAKQAVEIMERMTDIVSAMPGDMNENFQKVARALGQIWAKGKVQAEELTSQLAEAGIPAWEALAKTLGTTVAGAMKKVEAGQVSAATGIRAILSIADDPRFKGLGQKLSQTLAGLFSSFKSQASQLAKSFGDIIVEGFDLKRTTAAVTAFFEHLRTNIEFIKPLVFSLGAVFGIVRDVILEGATLAVANGRSRVSSSGPGVRRCDAVYRQGLDRS
jgi:tape measure domain-containing protein